MTPSEISLALKALRKIVADWEAPSVAKVARKSRDPYRVLVSCLISLRTKDEVTHAAGERLFPLADSPEKMIGLSEGQIAEAIYPAGFYRTKARTLKEVSRTLLDRFDGRVPDDLDPLLTLKGVGRKTANLVLTKGFGKPGICVDAHVHRICNRWGYVKTKTPDRTEAALREKLPKEHWIEINDLLVAYGKKVCAPISPKCSICPISEFCNRIGVGRSR